MRTTERKILILGTSPLSKGGIGTVVKGFNESVRPKGYSFNHIVTHSDCGNAAKVILAVRAYLKCLFDLRKENYDLVHMHTAFGASFFRSIPFIRLAIKRGVPVINHIHSDDWHAFYDCSSSEKRQLISNVYSSCDRVIALSEEWRDILTSVVPDKKIVILENFTPIYEEEFYPHYRNKVVLFMSRLERIKGCDLLPSIIELVVSKVPDVKFVICGEGGMEDDLRREIIERSLTLNVKLMGWIDGARKADVLKQSSIFLLPSYSEGMPMCILEAMGMGLPVISTHVGGIPKLVEDGKNGYLSKPGDFTAIANDLVRLLNNPNEMARMGEEGKAQAKSRSIAAYDNKLKEIYDSLLKEKH